MLATSLIHLIICLPVPLQQRSCEKQEQRSLSFAANTLSSSNGDGNLGMAYHSVEMTSICNRKASLGKKKLYTASTSGSIQQILSKATKQTEIWLVIDQIPGSD